MDAKSTGWAAADQFPKEMMGGAGLRKQLILDLFKIFGYRQKIRLK